MTTEHKPHSTQRLAISNALVHAYAPGDTMYREAMSALDGLIEQFEVLRGFAQEVESLAFRQYIDWMHFHELAMAKPFEAEIEAQEFARRVSSLLTLALGPDSTLDARSELVE